MSELHRLSARIAQVFSASCTPGSEGVTGPLANGPDPG
ncbi:hypothetical protein HRUBRA_02542 [Pseudohaliea rubra DSM 19751]|uniref:Uncharacterized protein n=1 Tax=Pseudohaliea rubra DSM 19751 TaxID=1265313 RepID=A0A095VP47_9GAMM|nr:hypothetical protein HRUBRA_02542 [Pseudohaliea rubra DSM 19751]